MYTDNFKPLNAVTADTTSEAFDVSQRELKSIQFIAASITSGNGVFTVEVSNDGVNFIAYNRLVDNVTKNNTQTDSGVASCTLSSNTSKIYFFPDGDYFRFIRVLVNMTTDGAYSAILQVGS